ncbi:MAG: flagellar export protein FliJ [Bacteroidota bacterium]|nr:flagellar export protein FliJ [Bacteroidota bacterium]
MAKFTYKYESITRIKETLQKKVQKEVSSIDLEIEKLYEEIDNIIEEINKSIIDPTKKRISARDLQFAKNYIKELNDNINRIEGEIEKLKIKRQEKIQELIKKSKEAKIFNTLKDIHHENFNIEEKRKEMIDLDEIATQKFTRAKK